MRSWHPKGDHSATKRGPNADARPIVVSGLTKTYGAGDHRVQALRDVSFEIRRGEIFALLGPNGAGKTTAVEILATLRSPSAGSARVAGFDVLTQPREVRLRIGVALQQTGLDEAETVGGLLTLHARLCGYSAADAAGRADRLLRDLELQELTERRVAALSGGLKRRVDLALALVGEPQVLFLDEPTTGLDPGSRRTVWRQVEELGTVDVTVLLTTQYLEEADRLAHRVAILDQGRIVAEGSPGELKRSLANDIVEIAFEDAETASRAMEAVKGAALRAVRGGPLLHGERLRVDADDGAALAARLLGMLEASRIRASAVTVTQPTLDDVYLAVTGRELRAPDA